MLPSKQVKCAFLSIQDLYLDEVMNYYQSISFWVRFRLSLQQMIKYIYVVLNVYQSPILMSKPSYQQVLSLKYKNKITLYLHMIISYQKAYFHFRCHFQLIHFAVLRTNCVVLYLRMHDAEWLIYNVVLFNNSVVSVHSLFYSLSLSLHTQMRAQYPSFYISY